LLGWIIQAQKCILIFCHIEASSLFIHFDFITSLSINQINCLARQESIADAVFKYDDNGILAAQQKQISPSQAASMNYVSLLNFLTIHIFQ
jgi:hypothetical protein